MKLVYNYDLLISCPSDVSGCVSNIKSAVRRFNETYGAQNNIVIRTLDYKANTYPTMGQRPQESVNNQIVNKSDMTIAVFGAKFGTPTDTYGSGTEEEIEHAIQNEKQVFLYFLKSKINPSSFDNKEYVRVQNFQAKHRNNSLYREVDSNSKLGREFEHHLQLYFEANPPHKATENKIGKSAIPYEYTKLIEVYFKDIKFKKSVIDREFVNKVLWVSDNQNTKKSIRDLLTHIGIQSDVIMTNTTETFEQYASYSLILVCTNGYQEAEPIIESIRSRCEIFTTYLDLRKNNKQETISFVLRKLSIIAMGKSGNNTASNNDE